jgi:hypothetical protein
VAAAPQIKSAPAPKSKEVSLDDDEDVMSYFKKIAQEE